MLQITCSTPAICWPLWLITLTGLGTSYFVLQVLNLLDAGAGAADTYTVMLQDIPEEEDDDYLKVEHRESTVEVDSEGVALEELDGEHAAQATRAAELDRESNRNSILLTPEQALNASKEAARIAMEASKEAAKKAAMETANATLEALRRAAPHHPV